jgi:lysophospholipase L1-like esterase
MNGACDNGECSHDALWGWSFDLAKNYIGQEVSTYQPNYLLIELGFNDIAFLSTPAGTLADAETLIDNARAVDPDVRILIANVVHHTPVCGYPDLNSNIDTYNADLAAAVPGWSTANSPVNMVDIESGYNPAIGADSYDGVHPDPAGEYEIAMPSPRPLQTTTAWAASPARRPACRWSRSAAPPPRSPPP